MASQATEPRKLEVHPNEYDGWDVKFAGEADAISNHPDKEGALAAAHKLAEHEGHAEVVVSDEVDRVSDEGRGTMFYFVFLLGLLVLVTLIIVVVSVIGGSTEFGANDANLGE